MYSGLGIDRRTLPPANRRLTDAPLDDALRNAELLSPILCVTFTTVASAFCFLELRRNFSFRCCSPRTIEVGRDCPVAIRESYIQAIMEIYTAHLNDNVEAESTVIF